MKVYIGFMVAALLSLTLPAQRITILEGPAAQDWIEMAEDIQRSYKLNEAEILNPAPQRFNSTIMDTLRRYDWLRVGWYWYNNDGWGPEGLNSVETQKSFYRFQADGVWLWLNANPVSYGRPIVFDDGHDILGTLKLVEEHGYTWLAYEETPPGMAGRRIVSYRDGVLIIDNNDRAVRTDNINYRRRYRNVYLRIPQTF